MKLSYKQLLELLASRIKRTEKVIEIAYNSNPLDIPVEILSNQLAIMKLEYSKLDSL